MNIKYNADFKVEAITNNLAKITGQIYKLLPYREEEQDWKKPLSTVIEELSGMSRLLFDQQEALFSLCCKLEGLYTLDEEKDFKKYRSYIFECLSIINEIKCQLETT
jgi:hypothetical protein